MRALPERSRLPDAPIVLVKKEFVEREEVTREDVWTVDAATSFAPIIELESICMDATAGYRDQSPILEISPAFASRSPL
jgi:hypothetical protein